MSNPQQPTPSEIQSAVAQIKAVYDEGVATINNRDYKFTTAAHRQRVTVFAFFSKVQHQIQAGDFSFLDTKEFEAVERVVSQVVTFDGSLLSKRPTHWEEFPEDYLTFIPTALGVISYPFLRGNLTG